VEEARPFELLLNPPLCVIPAKAGIWKLDIFGRSLWSAAA